MRRPAAGEKVVLQQPARQDAGWGMEAKAGSSGGWPLPLLWWYGWLLGCRVQWFEGELDRAYTLCKTRRLEDDREAIRQAPAKVRQAGSHAAAADWRQRPLVGWFQQVAILSRVKAASV